MADAGSLLFVVPGDPGQRTGGYRYVNRLVEALNERGAKARVQGIPGRFPIADGAAESAMDRTLAECPEGSTVILDGLAMGGLPTVVEKHARRLRLIALVHHPLADETGLSEFDAAFLFTSESRALAAVDIIITTSKSTAHRLNDFAVPESRVGTVEPGADTVRESDGGSITSESASFSAEYVSNERALQILCVAGLSPRKAQHQLIEALSKLIDLPWHCTLAGSTERDEKYSRQLVAQVNALGLGERIHFAGELADQDLARCYQNADLFVLPSLYEGYGMVIDEALVAGLPVITTDGGALADTGNRPGILQYPAGSPDALRECLERCLSDSRLLMEMADAAKRSAASIRRWSDAAEEFIAAIGPRDSSQFDLGWLSLREPADHRARSEALLARLKRWVESAQAAKGVSSQLLKVVDIGSGAGSNGVFLSKSLAVPQYWTLMDQDAALLAKAKERLEPLVDGLEVISARLEEGNLSVSIPSRADLITASALIDLVSRSWLDAFSKAVNARGAAVYIVLSYAGDFSLSPGHADDDLIRRLVNDHQHGYKGSGAALGPEATDCLKAQLEALGYSVTVESSPWQLDGADRELQAALISGWCQAALEQAPEQQGRIERWQSARLASADSGELSVRVDHQDLFAWPEQSVSS